MVKDELILAEPHPLVNSAVKSNDLAHEHVIDKRADHDHASGLVQNYARPLPHTVGVNLRVSDPVVGLDGHLAVLGELYVLLDEGPDFLVGEELD